MRAGIIVKVTRADRHRLEAIVSDVAHLRSMCGGPTSCHCRRLWHRRDHAPLGQVEACGVEMAVAVHGGGRRRADARQDAQARQATAADRHCAESGRSGARAADGVNDGRTVGCVGPAAAPRWRALRWRRSAGTENQVSKKLRRRARNLVSRRRLLLGP